MTIGNDLLTLVNSEREGIATLKDFNYSWSVLAANQNLEYPTPGLHSLLALESMKDLAYIPTLQAAALGERSGLAPKSQSKKSDVDTNTAQIALDTSRNVVQRLHLDPIEPIEYTVGGDPGEGTIYLSFPIYIMVSLGDVVADLDLPKSTGKTFHNSINNIIVGTRLDAIDHKGQWYPGTFNMLHFVMCTGQVLAVGTDTEPKIR